MPASVDQLYIDITANAVRANDAIDRLVTKLDRLSITLTKVNGSSITGLANGVQRLGTAMQTMNSVKTADFTRLASNLTKLGSLNVASLNSTASAMSQLTRAFNTLGTVSQNAQQVGVLASNLSKLGNKGVTNAITNLPRLATALRNLMTTLSTAPRVGNNVIQLANALANLASQGRNVGTASTLLNTGLTRTGTTMKRVRSYTFSLAAAFGRFYATYFLVIRGIKALWKSIESTADYIEAYNYQTVALEKIASEWQDDYAKYGYENADAYSDSFQKRLNENLSKLSGIQINVGVGLLEESGLKNLGLNIQEITQYASQLASVTNSVGQTGETSLAVANAFTKLAGDISSLFNLDYSSVAQNLQSGLIGQSRALYKYGIDITNATLQTYAYELGLEKAVSEMSQMEKQQLRVLAILDQSKVSWGDLANTIESPSNMVRQFKNNMSELGIVFGQLFIPVLQKVLPYINGFTIALKRLFVSIASALGIELDFSSFGQGYTEMEEDIDGVSDALDGATEAAKKFKSATIGIDKLNIISEDKDSTGTGSGLGSAIDLTDEILKATEEYNKVWNAAYDKMESKAQKIADNISKTFSNIGNAFKTGGMKGVGEYISKALTKELKSIDWESIYASMGNFGTGLANFLNGLISPDLFATIGTTIASYLNSAISGAFSFGMTFDFANLGESIASGINEFFSTFDFAKLADTIDLWVQGLFTTLITALSEVDWKKVFEGVKDFLTNLDIETIAIIIGAVTIKKIGIVSIASAALTFVATSISQKLASVIAAKLGLQLASGAGIGAALVAAGTAMGTTLMAGFKAALGSEAALAALAFINPIIKVITGISSIVAGAFMAVSNFVTMLTNGFSWLNEALMFVGIALTAVGAIILGANPIVTGVIAGIVAAVTTAIVVVKDNWQKIKDWFIGLANWFKTNVIEPIKEKFNAFKDKITKIFEGTWIVIKAVWIVVSDWFNDNVIKPLVKFFKPKIEKISKFFSDLWEDIKVVWGVVAEWFSTTIIDPLSSAFETACNAIAGFFTGLWDGIKSGVIGAINAVIGVIEKGINFVGDAINGLLGGFNAVVKWAAEITGDDWEDVELIKKVSLPRIPEYATGGFPEDGLFLANHNELVGRFSNGKTAVANNGQIIQGIQRGVEQAMKNVLSSGSFGNTNVTNRNVLELDGKVVAQNTNRYNAKIGTTIFGNETNYNFGY